jgi:hypothetical protein
MGTTGHAPSFMDEPRRGTNHFEQVPDTRRATGMAMGSEIAFLLKPFA